MIISLDRCIPSRLVRPRSQHTFWLLALVLVLWAPPAYAEPPRLLEVDLPGARLFGMPVHWSDYDAALLEPTGRFHVFDVEQVRRYRLLDEDFRPETLPEARSRLQAELGSRYETLVAGPYVIAAPAGATFRWQARFTSLLAGYTRYFEVRGWPLRRPDFPLIVIVFESRDEFTRYCASQAGEMPSQAVGSYFPKSNRCVLYQIPGSRGTDWSETEATIVHEAVHQLAYNTGVHERLFVNPVWFVEGLATMFEQPAVYDLSVHRSTLATRLNSQQLAVLQPLLKTPAQLEAHVKSLVVSDQLFRSDARTAYAVSWGLTFYLAERMPSQYRNLIELQSRRRFGRYSSAEREQDFLAAIGVTPSQLAVQMPRLLLQENSFGPR